MAASAGSLLVRASSVSSSRKRSTAWLQSFSPRASWPFQYSALEASACGTPSCACGAAATLKLSASAAASSLMRMFTGGSLATNAGSKGLQRRGRGVVAGECGRRPRLEGQVAAADLVAEAVGDGAVFVGEFDQHGFEFSQELAERGFAGALGG